jgi:RNA polymerase sigma-70 factor (ECF subfamily)
MVTDDELMRAYLAGDAGAFEALYRRYDRRVYGFFLRALSDPALAEDLLQKTFLKLHRARASYRADGPVGGWIFRIAFNLYRDELRRRRRHPEDASDDELEDRPALDRATDELLDERAQIVRRAVDDLPQAQREAILLCKYQELSYEEAAKITNAKPDAMKLRVFRALKSLRQRFGTAPDDPAGAALEAHRPPRPPKGA